MYTLTVKRDSQTFRFCNRDLLTLQIQAGEYDSAEIVDISGAVVYALALPAIFKLQAV